MKRLLFGLVALSVFALGHTGCVAVSSTRTQHHPSRYDAVTIDGQIYVVDTVKCVAREVPIVEISEFERDCEED